MSAWITPALAAVFWAGLLLQPRVGEFADPWVWLSAGGGLLGAALALAPGRVRVAVAFADLAGYTRFTEDEGEEEALSFVERFVEGVTNTLPDDARVVKTIGDEVMVVGQDIRALVDWAVGFTSLFDERPEPRIGVHWGTTLYRDGDYFGRDVNLAARVVARARGGEVLVTDSVVEAVGGSPHLSFDAIGQVKLKGFAEPRQLCRAVLREPDQ